MIKSISTEELNNMILDSEKDKEKVFVVHFFKEDFIPCKVMIPILMQIESDNQERIVIKQIDVEGNPDAALKYRVLSVPTLLFIKSGKIVGKLEGAVTKSMIEQKIAKW